MKNSTGKGKANNTKTSSTEAASNQESIQPAHMEDKQETTDETMQEETRPANNRSGRKSRDNFGSYKGY